MNAGFDLQGKAGILTGAASGIGRATALLLAQHQVRLCVADLDDKGLTELAEQIKALDAPAPLTVNKDVADEAQVNDVVSQGLAHFGKVNFLVNCAGILRRTSFTEIETAEWDLMMAINLRAVFLCCRAVAPYMIAQGQGVIVNVASVAGRSTSILGGAHYTAAKHAVIGLSRHMARELGPQGIRVNAFCPGATLTPMIHSTTSLEEQEKVASVLPLRRWARPDEQAGVLAFMLSETSGYMTGACVDSNGGSLMI
jgi:3-oxoacyl-[acyl-carrier protein] reductase